MASDKVCGQDQGIRVPWFVELEGRLCFLGGYAGVL